MMGKEECQMVPRWWKVKSTEASALLQIEVKKMEDDVQVYLVWATRLMAIYWKRKWKHLFEIYVY